MAKPSKIYHTVIPPSQPSTHTTSRIFHIFYTTIFYLLYIALLGLILVTPGDAIHQALQNKQLYNVFVIAAAYFVTAFLAILIYASRIYTTRSVLAAIPRNYIPVEEGDVKEKVRRVVKRGLGRSAGVAWLARPRVQQCAQGTNALCLAEEIEERREHAQDTKPKLAKRVLRRLSRKRRKGKDDEKEGKEGEMTGTAAATLAALAKASLGLNPPAFPHYIQAVTKEGEVVKEVEDSGLAIWGRISHPGWSSPTSKDLPNLHYHPVIAELPHLVEAKVVALSGPTADNLAMLTRPVSAGLREYLNLLVQVGCLDPDVSPLSYEDEDEKDDKVDGEEKVHWRSWLVDYEYARFSGEAVTEEQFRDLMVGFAKLLRSLRGIDGQVGEDTEDEASDWDEGEAYSVHSKSTGSRESREESLKSKKSQHSFLSMDDRRSILTAGTVEKNDVEGAQVPSYLSSPLPTFTPMARSPQPHSPQPRMPSPRQPPDRLSHLYEVKSQENEYEMQDMANTPESVIKRQPRHQSAEEEQPQDMTERIRLGPNGGMSQADSESMLSFQTESDAGSVIRHSPSGLTDEEEHEYKEVEGLHVPQQVPLPRSGNASSPGTHTT